MTTFTKVVFATFVLLLASGCDIGLKSAQISPTGTRSNERGSQLSVVQLGAVRIGSSGTQNFLIANSGNTPATLSVVKNVSLPFLLDGGFPGAGGTCHATLAAHSTCLINVSFRPTTSGSFIDTLEIGYNDGTLAQTIVKEINAQGIDVLSVSVTQSQSPDFTYIAPTAVSDVGITVTNNSGADLSAITLSNVSSPFILKTNNCRTLANGKSCAMTVGFTPTSVGTFTNQASLTYTILNLGVSIPRALMGLSYDPRLLAISDKSGYTFNPTLASSSDTHVFTLTNNTGSTISGISFDLQAPFSKQGTTCTGSLNYSDQCTVTVKFAPSSAALSQSNLVVGYSSLGTSPSISIPLKGQGIDVNAFTISDNPFDYGAVTTSTTLDHVFTLTNATGAQVTVSPAQVSSPLYTVKSQTCDTVANGGRCTITVTFSPKSVGMASTNLTAGYSVAGQNLTVSSALTGLGITMVSSQGNCSSNGTVSPNFGFSSWSLPTSERMVFQRRSGNMGTVTITGKLQDSNPNFDQANHYCVEGTLFYSRGSSLTQVAAWTKLRGLKLGSDGTFSGSFDGPSGGWYQLSVRVFKDSAPSAMPAGTLTRVGIGDVFITAGQSNATNYGESPSDPGAYLTPDDRTSAMNNQTGAWQFGGQYPLPAPDQSTGGAAWPKMANDLVNSTGAPVGFIEVGSSGTSVQNWLMPADTSSPYVEKVVRYDSSGMLTTTPDNLLYLNDPAPSANPPTPSPYIVYHLNLFNGLMAAVKFSNTWLGGAKAILWVQGESDNIGTLNSLNQPILAPLSNLNYALFLRQVITDLRAQTQITTPWFISLTGWTPTNNDNLSNIISGQQAAATGAADSIFVGPATYDMTSSNKNSDGTCNQTGYRDFCHNNGMHFGNAGLMEHGRRWAQTLLSTAGFNLGP